jgi:hypothetical protein
MSAEIELSWGDSVLFREIASPGKRVVVGELRSADFVAPVETHVVRVDAQGAVFIEAKGVVRALAVCGHECIALGPLSLRVSRTTSETERFASSSWLFDLGCVALVALYAGLVSAVSMAWIPPRATAETFEQQRLFNRAFGFSIEVEDASEPSALLMERPAPTSQRPKAIFAETPAQAFGPRARLDGRSVPKNEADHRRGGTGARARGAEGRIGALYAPQLVGTWAMKDRENVRLAKQHTPRRSWVFSMVNPEEADDEELTAEWGEEADGSGQDEQDVVGNMLEEEPVDPPGMGLGVLGHRNGGGGEAKRLGTGRRNLGHGDASSANEGHGVVDASTFHRDVGRATHTPRAPSSRIEVAPVVIERVLARARGHFRACGARGESVTFDVGLDGSPTNASTPNTCVARVLSGLQFLPAGKVVTRARGRVGL